MLLFNIFKRYLLENGVDAEHIIVNGTKKPWRNDEGFVIMGMRNPVYTGIKKEMED